MEGLDLNKIVGKLDDLNDVELAAMEKFLKTIGVDLGKLQQQKLQAKSHAEVLIKSLPEEYDLVILCKCQTCGVHEELYFHMQRSLEQWGLVSVRLEEKPKVFRFRTETIDTCRHCDSVLRDKSQEELIMIVFSTVNRCKKKIETLLKIGL